MLPSPTTLAITSQTVLKFYSCKVMAETKALKLVFQAWKWHLENKHVLVCCYDQIAAGLCIR